MKREEALAASPYTCAEIFHDGYYTVVEKSEEDQNRYWISTRFGAMPPHSTEKMSLAQLEHSLSSLGLDTDEWSPIGEEGERLDTPEGNYTFNKADRD